MPFKQERWVRTLADAPNRVVLADAEGRAEKAVEDAQEVNDG